ncbi:amino acid adenylation domain-containing protein [Brevibacillus antibioticus]|uniref:Amino acid adenylation domain-containing protein n=1 Tax=Brevibacillus antibioticus TaxID=2570228 RepID=A0A4U2Y3N9_9BACL|nr:non-ribosomal peptide synthetase [Brevibacillus antibioticus]TKI55068.1 amino acid adenylation domain-containing protein [Brevibacillus antibioticus]
MSRFEKLDKQNIEDIVALSPVQEGILFHYLSDGNNVLYVEHMYYQLTDDINTDWFRQAWQVVVDTNEMLRTVFRYGISENPIQVILKHYHPPIAVYNEVLSKNEAESIRKSIRAKKMDIGKAPFEIYLLKLAPGLYEMILRFHHILFDGWSNAVLLKEFMAAYRAIKSHTPLAPVCKTKYKQFVVWNQKRDRDKQKAYWKSYLEGFETKTMLPIVGYQQQENVEMAEYQVTLSDKLRENMEQVAKQYHVTIATLLYCAWGVVLQRYNNTDDVLFGTTVSGRMAEVPGIEEIVGLFINTVPLRFLAQANEQVSTILQRLNRSLAERNAYESTPLVELKSCVDFDRKESLFDSIMVIENYPLDQSLMQAEQDFHIEFVGKTEVTNYDLTIEVSTHEQMSIHFIYHTAKFDPKLIEKMVRHFTNILFELTNRPDEPLNNLEMLSAEECKQLLNEFSTFQAPYPKEKSLDELIDEQAAKTPDKIALIYRDKSLTYQELWDKSTKLAKCLVKMGVVEDQCVGLMTESSLEMMIGILAVMKAGGAYLPIDVQYPRDRMRYMLENSGAGILLTQSHLMGQVLFAGKVICLDDPAIYEADDQAELPEKRNPDRLIYMIYTSGTTGQPKGVMVKHHAFVNLMTWYTEEFFIDENERILLIAPVGFDLAQKNLFAGLMKGGTLILYPSGLFDYKEMADLIDNQKITLINCTPSAFYPLLDFTQNDQYQKIKSLRKVFLGGESINCQALAPLVKSEYYTADIYNTYGPTECTDVVSFYLLDFTKPSQTISVPIGKPVYNTFLYVLDRFQKLQPVGVPGELYIGGVGVGRGYKNNPELTKQKFVPNPFVPGELMYGTGDLVKWLPDGNLDFIGRVDNQVKIRGYRIELGAIEKTLLEHEAIKEAAVICKEWNGAKYLVAFYVPTVELLVRQVKEYAENKLPTFMLPQTFVQLEALPLTPNGKIDKKKLAQYEPNMEIEAEAFKPTSEAEEFLLNIWRTLLRKQQIGVHHSFFELGGDSLLLIRMHAMIEKHYPDRVTVADLFAYPTIAKLSQFLTKANVKEKEPLSLPKLPLPIEYFGSRNTDSGEAFFTSTPNQHLWEKVTEIASQQRITSLDVLISVALFFFNQVSKQQVITLHSMSTDTTEVCNVTADFAATANFTELFHTVARQRANPAQSYPLRKVCATQRASDKQSVTLLFYEEHRMPQDVDLTTVYDLYFGLQQKPEQVIITCHYQNNHLNRQKVRQLFQSYMTVLAQVFESYSSVKS